MITPDQRSDNLKKLIKNGHALTLRFVRNSSDDKQEDQIQFSGYDIFWPNGMRVNLSVSRFCQFGVRALFGRKGPENSLLTMYLIPLAERDFPLPKLPRGIRARRLSLQRSGDEGRLLLVDGTPTEIVFNLAQDDERVLNWVGLRNLSDGGNQWYDLVVLPVED